MVFLRDLRAANGAVKLVRVVHSKRLGLFRQPRTGSTLPVTVSRLSKLTFDGEGNISAKDHLNKFWCKCIKHDISDLGVLCRLFAFTFRGRIKHWFESFPACHIFDWFQFVDEFLDAFEIYDFDQLCEEFHTSLINDDSSSEEIFDKSLSYPL